MQELIADSLNFPHFVPVPSVVEGGQEYAYFLHLLLPKQEGQHTVAAAFSLGISTPLQQRRFQRVQSGEAAHAQHVQFVDTKAQAHHSPDTEQSLP
jgi:hypothetical protein